MAANISALHSGPYSCHVLGWQEVNAKLVRALATLEVELELAVERAKHAASIGFELQYERLKSPVTHSGSNSLCQATPQPVRSLQRSASAPVTFAAFHLFQESF